MKLLIVLLTLLSINAHANTDSICRKIINIEHNGNSITNIFLDTKSDAADFNSFEYNINKENGPELFRSITTLLENNSSNDLTVCLTKFKMHYGSDHGGYSYAYIESIESGFASPNK